MPTRGTVMTDMTARGEIHVRKVAATRLYEALVDGRVVGTLAYETSGGRTSLTHSFVDPDRRHAGVGSALAEFALADATGAGDRPSVYCGFVADYVAAHPRWAGLVDVHRSALIPTRSSRP